MLLSSRSKQIIAFLAQQADYVTYEEIGKQIGVSGRTVLREMDTVEEWLSDRNLELIKKSRYGIRIEGNQEEKNDLISELGNVTVYKAYTSKERQDIMLLDLIQSEEESKQYYYSSLLDVSDATISQDLHKLEERLKEQDVSIQRKPGSGIKLVGSETAKRQLLLNVFYDHLSKKQVLNIIRKELYGRKQNISAKSQAIQRLLYLISPDKLMDLETIVNKVIDEHDYPIADSSKLGLIVHLVLAVERVKNDEKITINEDVFKELKQSDEYTLADLILKEIEKEYGLDMPEDEGGYITMHIKGSRMKDVESNNFENELPNIDAIRITNTIIGKAEELTGLSLNEDGQLYNGLIVHLRPMLARMKMGLEIRNPLLEDIKKRYPAYFEFALTSQKPLEDYLGQPIPEEETGYICMHIGAAVERIRGLTRRRPRAIVTCTTGIGTSKMLAIRLEKEVPEIDVVDILSVIEINEEKVKVSGADLIISTVDLEYKELPVIVVSPMLSEKDANRLKNAIVTLPIEDYLESDSKGIAKSDDKAISQEDLIESIKRRTEYGQAIINFLEHATKDYSREASVEGVLREYIERYFEEEKRENVYLSLMRRENLGSIILEDHELAFLHCKAEEVTGLYCGTVSVELPLTHQGKDVRTVVVLIAPQEASAIEIDVVSEFSRQLVQSKELVHAILNGEESELKDTLSEIYRRLLERI